MQPLLVNLPGLAGPSPPPAQQQEEETDGSANKGEDGEEEEEEEEEQEEGVTLDVQHSRCGNVLWHMPRWPAGFTAPQENLLQPSFSAARLLFIASPATLGERMQRMHELLQPGGWHSDSVRTLDAFYIRDQLGEVFRHMRLLLTLPDDAGGDGQLRLLEGAEQQLPGMVSPDYHEVLHYLLQIYLLLQALSLLAEDGGQAAAMRERVDREVRPVLALARVLLPALAAQEGAPLLPAPMVLLAVELLVTGECWSAEAVSIGRQELDAVLRMGAAPPACGMAKLQARSPALALLRQVDPFWPGVVRLMMFCQVAALVFPLLKANADRPLVALLPPAARAVDCTRHLPRTCRPHNGPAGHARHADRAAHVGTGRARNAAAGAEAAGGTAAAQRRPQHCAAAVLGGRAHGLHPAA